MFSAQVSQAHKAQGRLSPAESSKLFLYHQNALFELVYLNRILPSFRVNKFQNESITSEEYCP